VPAVSPPAATPRTASRHARRRTRSPTRSARSAARPPSSGSRTSSYDEVPVNIHEHQAKELLRRYQVAVPDGEACYTIDGAVAAATRMGFPCVVKAQIHAGGRGKAGGVKVVRDVCEAEATARALLGKPLVTHQTGPQGRLVRRLLVERACQIAREPYPLVVTGDGGLLALDAKIGFDDNGLFRHPELRELRDPSEEDPREQEAAKHELSYIALDGNIGCMVNGAGLAMATMDIVKSAGGTPANFLDVGGGATAGKVAAAFRILLSAAAVRAIFINLFGGILRCDVLA